MQPNNNNSRYFLNNVTVVKAVDCIPMEEPRCRISVDGNEEMFTSSNTENIWNESFSFISKGFAPRIYFSMTDGDKELGTSLLDFSEKIQSIELTNSLEYNGELNFQGQGKGTLFVNVKSTKLRHVDRDTSTPDSNSPNVCQGYVYHLSLLQGKGFGNISNVSCEFRYSAQKQCSKISNQDIGEEPCWNEHFTIVNTECTHIDVHVFGDQHRRLGIVRIDIPAIVQGRSWGRTREFKLPFTHNDQTSSIEISLRVNKLVLHY